MSRYAVLWDIDGNVTRPAGVAVEADGEVLIVAPNAYGLPMRMRDEYRVLQPDSTDVTYRPDSPLYFEQVLIELSRMFAIGERDTVDVVDQATLMHLFQSKVLRQRISGVKNEYHAVTHEAEAGGRRRAGSTFRREVVPASAVASARRRTSGAAAA